MLSSYYKTPKIIRRIFLGVLGIYPYDALGVFIKIKIYLLDELSSHKYALGVLGVLGGIIFNI
jgi:hypothetical protein